MLAVYEHGYDSHSVNTHAYANGDEPWYSEIRMPIEGANHYLVDGKYVYGFETNEDGITYDELYAKSLA